MTRRDTLEYRVRFFSVRREQYELFELWRAVNHCTATGITTLQETEAHPGFLCQGMTYRIGNTLDQFGNPAMLVQGYFPEKLTRSKSDLSQNHRVLLSLSLPR